MTEDKQQKFTSKVRRGLSWVYTQAHGELERHTAAAGGGRVAGFNAAELADLEAALVWIEQNKEPKASA